MSNTYKMTNARDEVRWSKSSQFSGFPRYPRLVRPDPHDNADFGVRNAAEMFAYKTGCPVLVTDSDDGDRFVGIFGADALEPDPREFHGLDRYVYADAYRETVANWWAGAAEHALAEALIWAPIDGEDKAFRQRKNSENHNRAIIRRYQLLLRAERIRQDTDAPDMSAPELIAARDAAGRARDALDPTT